MRNAVVIAAAVLSATIVAAAAADAPPGASSCGGCHSATVTSQANSTVPPRLQGQDAAQVVAAMQAFKAGTRPSTVMDRIAKGFSDDEVKAIAAWYAAQKD